MQQSRTNKLYGLILLSAALLQFALLATSMITSLFFPAESGMQPNWSSYLIVLILLSIAAIGAYQIHTLQGTAPLAPRVGVLPGLILGIALAILLSIHGLGVLLFYAALGLPWLIVILIQNPATLSSVSGWLVLLSFALYTVIAILYSICSYRVTRRNGSARQGIWSGVLAALTTFLGATLTFSLINSISFFVFHTGSDAFAPSSFPGFSVLMNYLGSYQNIVELIVTWLLVPAMLGLLFALAMAFAARHAALRAACLQTNQIEPTGEEN